MHTTFRARQAGSIVPCWRARTIPRDGGERQHETSLQVRERAADEQHSAGGPRLDLLPRPAA